MVPTRTESREIQRQQWRRQDEANEAIASSYSKFLKLASSVSGILASAILGVEWLGSHSTGKKNGVRHREEVACERNHLERVRLGS